MPPLHVRFIPVPIKARHDGWSIDRQRRFIAELAATRCVLRACREVGMSSPSAYALRARPGAGSFAAAWDSALAFVPAPDSRPSPRAAQRRDRRARAAAARSKTSETDKTDDPPGAVAFADCLRKLRELS